jgi:hypothetical protein
MILLTVPGMLVLGRCGFRAALKFNSAILADLAVRGCAISFVMLARVLISSLVGFFLIKILTS